MTTQIRQVNEFIQECWVELMRVTWPDWPQLRSATLVVIVFCFLVSMVIWMMDIASRFFIDMIMGLFGA